MSAAREDGAGSSATARGTDGGREAELSRDGLDRDGARGPLDGIRILEVAAPAVSYAGRILRDLGADVILIEPPEGGSERRAPPFAERASDGLLSLRHVFVNAGKRAITLDLASAEGRALLLRLASTANVLLDTDPGRVGESSAATLRRNNPGLVVTAVTPFGLGGPYGGFAADDLTVLGMGGLLYLGGYDVEGPVAVFGHQSSWMASLVAAVAVLTAIYARRRNVEISHLDVSAQECVALALGDSLPEYSLNGRVPPRVAEHPREAGTGTYRCADGYVTMVAGRLSTGRSWSALVDWLVESGVQGADRLRSPEWEEFEYRRSPEAIAEFGEIFERFGSTRGKQELYREGQRRNIAIAPVNTFDDVLEDEQLLARDAFVELRQPELPLSLTLPGPAYRLSRSTVRLRGPAPSLGQHNAELYGELGIDAEERRRLFETGVI